MFPRRIFSIGLLGLCAIVALVSCRASVPRPLPSQEVLKRSIVANATNSKSSFTARITANAGETLSGTLVANGVLTGGGQWLMADSSFVIERSSPEAHQNMVGTAEFVYSAGDSPRIRFNSLSGMLADSWSRSVPLPLTGTWWRLPGATGSVLRTGAPDPEAVDQIVATLGDVNDLGIEREGNGEYLYHYEVDVSETPVDSSGFKGSLWIDAKSFILKRAIWHPAGIKTSLGDVTAVIDVEFGEAPDKIPQPAQTQGQPPILPLDSIFAIISQNR